jgi:hypothetical protein
VAVRSLSAKSLYGDVNDADGQRPCNQSHEHAAERHIPPSALPLSLVEVVATEKDEEQDGVVENHPPIHQPS